MTYKIKLLISSLLALLIFSGCMPAHMQVTDLKVMKPQDIIYVGRIVMDPPIQKDEILLRNVIGGGDIHKAFYAIVSDKYYTLEGYHAGDMSDVMPLMYNEDYYLKWDRKKPLNILGGWFITTLTGNSRETMMYTIRNGIKVKHSGKAKAVYVGTITFKRDEFFNIKDIDISQKGYKKAARAFRKKFKTKWKLEKGKLVSAR